MKDKKEKLWCKREHLNHEDTKKKRERLKTKNRLSLIWLISLNWKKKKGKCCFVFGFGYNVGYEEIAWTFAGT